MKSPHEPDDSTARRGMEGLIAAMRGRRAAVTVDAPPADAATLREPGGEDELAVAAWRAMHVPLSSGSGEDEGCDGGAPAYLERGAGVGRYVILRQLGAGGMGVVYAAYDPELDRKVALKLVLPGRADAEGRTRLLREAQALAKLSHRNVVAIHDVGTMGGQVWLAMEFVRGQTLREWLRTPRSWRAVLEVLRKAGRGLAAAHAAGVLHRDFKPDNVMVGARGRVRVMDFGLARARPHAVPSADESTIETVRTEPTLAMQVTQAGALLGTPVYMAPEQLLGREPTAAVDQYALCVTLWEALYGERPFAGGTHDELVEAVLAGKPRTPARGRGVPGWLRRVCERGLSTRPERRFASIDALLEALAKGHARARVRKGLAAVGILALLGLGGEGWRRFEHAQRVAACEASGDEIAAAWNDERAQALHDALLATGVSYAPTTARNVMPWLDRQAAAWSEARVETCHDAEVRGRWGEEMHARSLWCLDERRVELETLIDELLAADAEVVRKAVSASATLAAVEPCRNERMLEALGLPAEEQRDAIRELRAEITHAATLERAGRYDAGLELAGAALARAEALAWRPIVAEARYRVGSLLMAATRHADAEAALEDAFFEAAAGVAPRIAFDAATDLVFVVGYYESRPADGRRWARHAEAALATIADDNRLGHGQLLNGLAAIAEIDGENARARELQEKAVATLEQALGSEHPDLAASLNNLGNTYDTAGDYERARALHERALAIVEASEGPEHPHTADSLNNLAVTHQATGDYVRARSLYARALEIREQALGPESTEVGQSLTNLCELDRIIGEHARALASCTRALAIMARALGAAHPEAAMVRMSLGNIHSSTGAHSLAEAQYERTLGIFEAALGPEHVLVGQCLANLAIVHRALGAYDRAIAEDRRALAIVEASLGPEHPATAYPLLGLARSALARGRPAEAIEMARRATTAWAENAPDLLAEARFVLVRALWDAPPEAGQDRAQAVVLAEQAREAFRDAGEGRVDDLAEVEAWLAAHSLSPAPNADD